MSFDVVLFAITNAIFVIKSLDKKTAKKFNKILKELRDAIDVLLA